MPDEIFDKIFDLMNDAKHEKAIEYINNGQLKIVDCCDINGTTPLQYVISNTSKSTFTSNE